jgi:hypothetical protein
MGTIAAASSSTSSDPTVAIGVALLVLVGLAFIPANIAGKKGYSVGGFFLFGLFFFLPALIVALIVQDRKSGVAASTITWTRQGVRYAMGYVVENPHYGIWDLQRPGPPITKFPYTQHGKSEAEARFLDLEADIQEAASASPLPTPPPLAIRD